MRLSGIYTTRQDGDVRFYLLMLVLGSQHTVVCLLGFVMFVVGGGGKFIAVFGVVLPIIGGLIGTISKKMYRLMESFHTPIFAKRNLLITSSPTKDTVMPQDLDFGQHQPNFSRCVII